MNMHQRAGLVKSYGSIDAFVRKTSDVDFIWGIADFFGYEGPVDFDQLDEGEKVFVALSFFCKDYMQGGFSSVFSNLPEFLPKIDSGLELYEKGMLATEFKSILNKSRQQGVDLSDDEARWEFVENQRDFRTEFLKCQGALPLLVANLRDAIGQI